MAQMKYIQFLGRGFVVFERVMTHKQMAQKFPNDEVVSAGFVSMNVTTDEDHIRCGGESVSLKKSSHSDDSDRLTRRLSLYC